MDDVRMKELDIRFEKFWRGKQVDLENVEGFTSEFKQCIRTMQELFYVQTLLSMACHPHSNIFRHIISKHTITYQQDE